MAQNAYDFFAFADFAPSNLTVTVDGADAHFFGQVQHVFQCFGNLLAVGMCFVSIYICNRVDCQEAQQGIQKFLLIHSVIFLSKRRPLRQILCSGHLISCLRAADYLLLRLDL